MPLPDLLIHRWSPQAEVFGQIDARWRGNAVAGRPSLLLAYSFGKAQRLGAQAGQLQRRLCQRLDSAARRPSAPGRGPGLRAQRPGRRPGRLVGRLLPDERFLLTKLIVGCETASAVHFWLRRSPRTPDFCPMVELWACKSDEN